MNLKAFDNKHAGNRGFVIGGGPSIFPLLLRSDMSIKGLEREITVGANKAYKILEPTYLAICDWRFCVLYGKEMTQEAPYTYKFTKDTYLPKMGVAVPNLYGLKVDGDRMGQGFLTHSFEDPMTFPNAGGTALIIAYMLGLNPIFLVGIDCCSDRNMTHFHNDYDEKDQAERIKTGLYTRMMLVFEPLLKQLKKKGVTVYSCSSISALNDLIPYIDIRDAYNVTSKENT